MSAEKISPWVLRFTLLVSLPISAAALFLTRTYAVGNLAMLGLDADTVFVRRLSIDVLLAAHVAAFFLVALLPDEAFRFKRWQLYTLAFCIWAFDGGAIWQARFGGMDQADSVMVTASERFKAKKKTIDDLQASAAERRAQANREWANKRFTDAKNGRDLASEESKEAAKLTKELETMPSGAGTTEVRTWGKLAPYKAAMESALVSFVSLIMLGLSGMTLRELLRQAAAARPAPVASKPAILVTPVAPVMPAPAAPVAPAPAPVQTPAARAPAPKVSYNISSALLKALGFGFAAAGAAGAAAAAAPTPVQSTPARPAPAPAAAPAVAPAAPVTPVTPAPDTPEQVYPVTPERVQQQVQAAPQRVRKVRVRKTPPPAGARHDTGVSGDAAGRYTRLNNAVRAGGCAPSLAGVRAFARCNQDTAAKYLRQLAADGAIEKPPGGRGWKVKASA